MTRLEVTGGDRGVQNVKFTGHQELKFDKINTTNCYYSSKF